MHVAPPFILVESVIYLLFLFVEVDVHIIADLVSKQNILKF